MAFLLGSPCSRRQVVHTKICTPLGPAFDVTGTKIEIGDIGLQPVDMELQIVDVELHIADLEPHIGDVELHIADIELHIVDLNLHIDDLEPHTTDIEFDIGEIGTGNAVGQVWPRVFKCLCNNKIRRF